MGSLLVVLCLAAADAAGYEVIADAAPWKQLVQDERPQRWVVVAVPSGDPALDAITPRLQKKLVAALSEDKHVRSAQGARMDAALATRPDSEIATQLAESMRATRVLVVRVYPPDTSGGAAKVLFNLLDEEGEGLESATSMSVVVWRQGNVSKGVERIFRESSGDSEEEEEEEQRGGEPDDTRAEFFKRALVAREVEDEVKGTSTWVIHRDGQELTEAQLQALDAPELAAGKAGWMARNWPFVAFGPLEGVAVAIPFACCLLGGLAPFGICFGLYGASSLTRGQAPATALITGVSGSSYGVYCCPVTGVGSLVVGVITGLVVGAGGAAAMFFSPRASDDKQPALAFVREHNTALARELGLKVRKLPRKYFPKG